MARTRKLSVQFPLKGLDRRRAYRQSAPYSTPDAMNVRPFASIEGRERGGSRPGLDISHETQLGSNEIRMLECLNISQYDGFRYWSDVFNGTSMSSIWSQATWSSNMPSILSSFQSTVSYDVSEASAVRDAVSGLDSSQKYSIGMYIAPYNGAHHGTYTVYARMDNSSPDIEGEGIKAELTMTGTDGSFAGTLTSVTGGVETPYAFTGGTDGAPTAGWLTVTVNGDNITVTWRNNTLISSQAVTAHTDLRVGFGMNCTVAGGICICDAFRTQYYQDTDLPFIKDLLMAIAGGDLYREEFRGVMEVVTSALSFNDVELHSVQRGQNLYVADYGLVADGDDGTIAAGQFDSASYGDWTTTGVNNDDYVVVVSNGDGTVVDGTYPVLTVTSGHLSLSGVAGTGNCTFRVERAPKVYSPITNTIALLEATDGQVPSGNPLIARFRDRIVLAGADNAPHVWYMSRQADPTDWDYAEDDSQGAVAGTSSPAGVPGQPITALVASSDDYLIIGCTNSLWVMRGDPKYGGGELDNLSQTVGIVGANAWAIGPASECIFLSQDGIYIVPPGASGYPVSVSRELLPEELKNINNDYTNVMMEYDAKDKGIHIYLTPEDTNERVHWWMDWERKTFWPVQLQGDHEPFAIARMLAQSAEDTGVVLGCRDGYIRRYSSLNITDGGNDIETYLVLGPIPLGDDYNAGRMRQLIGAMAEDSGDVTWMICSGDTYEETLDLIADAGIEYFVDASGNFFVDASGNFFVADSGSAPDATGTWNNGLNHTVRPAGRGNAFAIKIVGGTDRWALERITATRNLVGRNRA